MSMKRKDSTSVLLEASSALSYLQLQQEASKVL